MNYLSRHDFCVGARDIDTSVKCSTIMSFDNITSENLVGSYTAIVRALRTGEAILWPAERMEIVIEQRIFLLNAEPGFIFGSRGHGFKAGITVIRLCRFFVVFVGVAEDKPVVAQTERISVNGHRVEVNI